MPACRRWPCTDWMTMARPRGTDGSLLYSLPWTMAAIGFALLPHVAYLPVWVTAALLLSGAWRYTIEKRRAALLPVLLRAALAFSCFIGVLMTFHTISGVGPGSALLAVMAAMKLLETRRRRDQYVLLFIALFLTMAALLREQFLWSFPYLLMSLALTLTAWLRMSGDRGERLQQTLGVTGRMLAYAAPVAIAMWVLFPRIATPFWSVPIDTGSATSGLSDTMSPGDISSLSLSDAVAFRAYFDGEVPEQRDLYWRGIVLTYFDGRGWRVNSRDSEPRIGLSPEKQLDVYGEPTHYRVRLQPTRQPWLFALDMPYQWLTDGLFMGPQQQLVNKLPVQQLMEYEVVSFKNYRAETSLSGFARRWYLTLPPGSNPRTVDLASRLRARAASDEDFIRTVLSRFTNQAYYYTLEPPPLGSNPVDRFMFDTRQGFCEHYASAFAVMMRAAGIPARVVLGYQGGEMHTSGDYMVVRQADAHAWTEVWLDGVGWRRVDPTAAVAPERVELGRAGALLDGVAENWGMTASANWVYKAVMVWDMVNATWDEWILGYGPDKQESFLEWLGLDDPNWRKLMWLMLGLVAAQVFVISVIMMRRNRPPRPEPAKRLYERFLRKHGITPQTGETPTRLAARLRSENADLATAVESVSELYLALRYGDGKNVSIEALRKAVR